MPSLLLQPEEWLMKILIKGRAVWNRSHRTKPIVMFD
jgi:hypothetical protein